MNSVKSLAMNCGPLSEMIRGRASGYFSLAACRMISMSASVIDSRRSQLTRNYNVWTRTDNWHGGEGYVRTRSPSISSRVLPLVSGTRASTKRKPAIQIAP